MEMLVSQTGQHPASPDVPVSLDDIAARLSQQIVDKLRLLIDAGFAEEDVVRGFITTLTRHFRNDGVARRVLDIIQRLATKGSSRPSELEQQIQAIVVEAAGARSLDHEDEIPAWLRRAATDGP